MYFRPRMSRREIGSRVVWFLLHTLAALLIGGIVSVLLTGAVENVLENLPSRYKTLTQFFDWYPPYVCAVGLILGFVANRGTLKRVACRVWISGAAWLAFGMLDSVRGYDPRFYQGCSPLENVVNAFFVLNGRRCGGGGSTLAGAFFTMPALNSVAYSVGAWVALRFGRSENVPSEAAVHLIRR